MAKVEDHFDPCQTYHLSILIGHGSKWSSTFARVFKEVNVRATSQGVAGEAKEQLNSLRVEGKQLRQQCIEAGLVGFISLEACW